MCTWRCLMTSRMIHRYLIFTGHFPLMSPVISGSFAENEPRNSGSLAENDLQLKASYESSPLYHMTSRERERERERKREDVDQRPLAFFPSLSLSRARARSLALSLTHKYMHTPKNEKALKRRKCTLRRRMTSETKILKEKVKREISKFSVRGRNSALKAHTAIFHV